MEKLKELKKKSEITEDDLKLAEKKMQDLTDKHCNKIGTLCEDKKKSIMEL